MVRTAIVACFLAGTSLLSSAWIQGGEQDKPVNRQIQDELAELGNLPHSGGDEAVDQVTAPPKRGRAVSPMMKEIFASVERDNKVVAELRMRLHETDDHSAAIDIVRQIEQTKLGIERNTLQIQLNYAQRDGRADAAMKLAKSIEALDRMRGERPADATHEKISTETK